MKLAEFLKGPFLSSHLFCREHSYGLFLKIIKLVLCNSALFIHVHVVYFCE